MISPTTPSIEEIGRVEDQSEVQRNDLQRRILHFFIGPSHEVTQHDKVVPEVARLKGRI